MELIKNKIKERGGRFSNGGLFALSSLSKFGWDLALGVYEKGENMVAKMSLPNMNPEEIDITLEDDVLTISGKREEEEELDQKGYYSREIRRGAFTRAVHLPKPVDASRSEAKYSDGVLTINMPKVVNSQKKSAKLKIKK